MLQTIRRPSFVLAALYCSWPLAVAQCAPQWLAGPSPAPDGSVQAVAAWDPDGPGPLGELRVVAGDFTSIGTLAANRIAAFDPQTGTWSTFGTGMDNRVRCLLALPDGDLLAGGDFVTAGGVVANCIARWNGTAWAPLGTGMAGPTPPSVHALATDGNDVFAGGFFATAGGVTTNHIARWNGAAWSALGAGTNGLVTCATVTVLGDLVIGGSFSTAGNTPMLHVASWQSGAWTPMANGLANQPNDLVALPNGATVALTGFDIDRWDGTTWTVLGNTAALETQNLIRLPDGDLLADGFGVWGGAFGDHLIRWNGTAWNSLGAATGGFVNDLALTAAGEVLVGGAFASVAGIASPRFAVLAPTCPASATALGGGCAGTLAALSLPWTGSTLHTRATGIAAPGLAIVVRGFAPMSLPLASVFPQGQPGCNLLVSPDTIGTLLATASTADALLPVPDSATLAGVQLFEQWVVFDVAAGFGPLTATGSLSLTIGTL